MRKPEKAWYDNIQLKTEEQHCAKIVETTFHMHTTSDKLKQQEYTQLLALIRDSTDAASFVFLNLSLQENRL